MTKEEIEQYAKLKVIEELDNLLVNGVEAAPYETVATRLRELSKELNVKCKW